MKDLKYYIKAFASVRRAPGAVWPEATKNQAPHKPLLLLALLDLAAGGILTSSFIDVQGGLNELNELFVQYWRRIRSLRKAALLCLSRGCTNDKPQFWALLPSNNNVITSVEINNINTVSQLRSVVAGAKIDDDLFVHLGSSDSRNACVKHC